MTIAAHHFPRGKDHCTFCGVTREQVFVSGTKCKEVLWPNPMPERRGSAMKSINTFAEHADRSRSWVYQQIRAGNLEAVRIGRRFVITAEAERRFYQKVNSGQLADGGAVVNFAGEPARLYLRNGSDPAWAYVSPLVKGQ